MLQLWLPVFARCFWPAPKAAYVGGGGRDKGLALLAGFLHAGRVGDFCQIFRWNKIDLDVDTWPGMCTTHLTHLIDFRLVFYYYKIRRCPWLKKWMPCNATYLHGLNEDWIGSRLGGVTCAFFFLSLISVFYLKSSRALEAVRASELFSPFTDR